ncbi:hypothetical protein SARC_00992 [Sphaeroforma arctica JP610]|uniref:Uncharacterized protein n=1 Tax=Sphaeroforma arctica JP610 TaxID=667725 RepID=A0A0L0GD02_9EUKA|nr:hypothetical protein SARC_00992 [Sphaeroforma arctica JP610]KNC86897.1 hypothetical protein SARC_00992 [Sphaeroforma arctica JP610]|eukprot:XP_014160799.1 hypothetical protein SARC_00992 [Sphaeroforma arctica JP610]
MSIHSSVDPTGALYACLSTDGRLRIYDTATSKLVVQHVSDANLSDAYTCLAWNPSASNPTQSTIALGTRSGSVHLFDIAKSEVVKELKGHTEQVNAMIFSDDGSTLYTCSNDKHVQIWKVESGTSTSRFQADDHKVTALALCQNGKSILTAGRTVKLWDLDTKKTTKNFSGQEESIIQICVYPNGNQFLTFDNVGRFANVWNLKGKTAHTVGAIALQAASKCIAVTHSSSPDAQCNVVAVSHADEVRVWEVPNKKEAKSSGKQSKNPVFRCTFVSETPSTEAGSEDKSGSVPTSVLYACFNARLPENELCVVRGTPLRPAIENVSYKESTGKWSDGGTMARAPIHLMAATQQSDADARASRIKAAGDNAHIIGADNVHSEMPMNLDGQVEKKTPKTSQQDGPVLGDMIEIEQEDDMPTKRSRGKTTKADSLAKLLAQALHSNDLSLLEECISNTNEHVVRNTVQHLPTPYVIPFLEAIVAKFQAKPVRGAQLVPWIKTVMVVHTSYLMTVPNVRESLGGLSSLVDARLSVFRKLLALNGRLDLLLSQISVQAQLDGVSGLKENAVTFKDEDTSDSESESEDSQSEDEDAADDDMVEYSGDSEDESDEGDDEE